MTVYAQKENINSNPQYFLTEVTDNEIIFAENIIDENNGHWPIDTITKRKYKMNSLSEHQKICLEKAVVKVIKYMRQIGDLDWFERPKTFNTSGQGMTIDNLPKIPQEAIRFLSEGNLLNHGYDYYKDKYRDLEEEQWRDF